MKRVVVKLGSSVVADGDGEPRMEVLAEVCDAARAAAPATASEAIVVTSGAIARGMRVMDLPQRPTTVGELQAASAVGQGKLYRIYDELLRERGVTSAQVLLTFFDMSARTHYLNARQTLTTLLDWRVMPVINENDTTATDEISFGDNDFLAAQVAVLVAADELVLLTDIDGLYTADPRVHPDARIVDEVDDFAALDELEIGHTTSPLGSGGMRSKVVAAEMATAAGIATVICNGLRAEALAAVLGGGPDAREGTRFPARDARYSSFKLWLKYAKPTRGTPRRRRGRRARGARGQGEPAAGRASSRCSASSTRATPSRSRPRAEHGRRARADDRQGHLQLLGATELRQVIGLKSAAVREILPRATDEAVHRDYLVLD